MLYQHFVTSWHLVLSCSVPKGSAKKKQRKNTAYKKKSNDGKEERRPVKSPLGSLCCA